MDRGAFWDRVYAEKTETGVSWHQPDPRRSLELIRAAVGPAGRVLDVGGGASVLVDRLLDLGYSNLAVLDVSAEALRRAAERLGGRADRVRWIAADATTVESPGEFDVWHDRAVFHFLVDEIDRYKYVQLANNTVAPGGRLVLATFGLKGPERCSGLRVRRYDAPGAAAEFAAEFELVESIEETHQTPWGAPQEFIYVVLRRR